MIAAAIGDSAWRDDAGSAASSADGSPAVCALLRSDGGASRRRNASAVLLTCSASAIAPATAMQRCEPRTLPIPDEDDEAIAAFQFEATATNASSKPKAPAAIHTLPPLRDAEEEEPHARDRVEKRSISERSSRRRERSTVAPKRRGVVEKNAADPCWRCRDPEALPPRPSVPSNLVFAKTSPKSCTPSTAQSAMAAARRAGSGAGTARGLGGGKKGMAHTESFVAAHGTTVMFPTLSHTVHVVQKVSARSLHDCAMNSKVELHVLHTSHWRS
jgi:hypothetical protein